jgi:hypothetical protein
MGDTRTRTLDDLGDVVELESPPAPVVEVEEGPAPFIGVAANGKFQ